MKKVRSVRVKVSTSARRERVQDIDGRLVVQVREPAEQNAANARVRVLIARHFGVEEKAVRLVAGHHRPQKTYQVLY